MLLQTAILLFGTIQACIIYLMAVFLIHRFSGATSFNQDVGSWSLDALTDLNVCLSTSGVLLGAHLMPCTDNTLLSLQIPLQSVFYNAHSFNQPISWDVSLVTDMSYA